MKRLTNFFLKKALQYSYINYASLLENGSNPIPAIFILYGMWLFSLSPYCADYISQPKDSGVRFLNYSTIIKCNVKTCIS